MSILVTGTAGFIGFNLSLKLLENGEEIIGFDNLNPYYDVNLKKARLKELQVCSKKKGNFIFYEDDLTDKVKLNNVFAKHKPDKVVHLAAQAGVRFSIENPSAYVQSNLVGFANILENCREYKIKNLLYASSSSVYGGNKRMPFKESMGVDHPVSLYAATKKSNELMAHTYSHLFNIPTIGLRFFTVYGPWGRPDMALYLFTKAILNDEPINVFNNGNMIRDFTYIDDICESLIRLLDKPAISDKKFDKLNPDPSKSWAPYRVFNIGNSRPTELLDYIKEIEDNLQKKAKLNYMEIQPGDVPATFADSSDLEKWIDFKPNTTIKEGVKRFIIWYKYYNKI